MPEAQTIDIETIEETTDLQVEQEQIERFEPRLQRLQTAIEQRIANVEQNLRGLRKQRDEEIEQLRDDYDTALSKGDANLAGEILEKIRKVRLELENLARNVMGLDDDLTELNAKHDELRLESMRIYEQTMKNWQLAETLMKRASGCVGGRGIGGDLLKLERAISDAKKVAQEILSE